ncbi:protein FAM124A-like [Glandiceps talaboti]
MTSTSSDDSFEGELGDPFVVSVHFIADKGEAVKLRDLFQPLLEWIDPEFKLFNIVERTESNGTSRHKLTNGDIYDSTPSLAVLLFLQEELLIGRMTTAQQYLAKSPWRFHHSVTPNGHYSLCPPNRQDFYVNSDDMPMWGVRQVHYGKEHLRFQIFCSETNWNDMIELYSLILGKSPDVKKVDFCYFTVFSQANVDVQLSLKRLSHKANPRTLNSSILQFKVKEVGSLVPLLPNTCCPISKRRWQTTDYDGNRLLLQVTKHSRRLGIDSGLSSQPRSRTESLLGKPHPGWFV